MNCVPHCWGKKANKQKPRWGKGSLNPTELLTFDNVLYGSLADNVIFGNGAVYSFLARKPVGAHSFNSWVTSPPHSIPTFREAWENDLRLILRTRGDVNCPFIWCFCPYVLCVYAHHKARLQSGKAVFCNAEPVLKQDNILLRFFLYVDSGFFPMTALQLFLLWLRCAGCRFLRMFSKTDYGVLMLWCGSKCRQQKMWGITNQLCRHRRQWNHRSRMQRIWKL